MLRAWIYGSLFLALLLAPRPALANGTCKLALVLAIDVSGSVNVEEYRLQMKGLSNALRAPDIANAIRFPGRSGIMATVVQWSGDPHQSQIVPWAYLSSEQSIEAFARAVDEAERAYINFSTAIGNALGFSASLFQTVPGECARKVIDVSGDGRNNEGVEVQDMRASVLAAGITINGLAIIGPDEGLPNYYREEVIGGPQAFVLSAKTFKDYPEVIRKKLLREIAPPLASAR